MLLVGGSPGLFKAPGLFPLSRDEALNDAERAQAREVMIPLRRST
jgi:hypothetical protein